MRSERIEKNKNLIEPEINQLKDLNEKKRELFEYADLEDRVDRVDAGKKLIDNILEDWEEGNGENRLEYMEAVSEPLMEVPSVDGDRHYPPLLRLYSFDRLTEFFEEDPKSDEEKNENVYTASNMLYAIATSSSEEEMQNSFLGLLSYYSDQDRFDNLSEQIGEKQSIVDDGVSLSKDEEKELIEKQSLLNKMKNFRETLGSIADDEDEDSDIRYLANLSFGGRDYKKSDSLNRGKYFAKLYEGDRDKFFAELEELEEKSSGKSEGKSEKMEIKYEDFSHVRLLAEGVMPGAKKEDEARLAKRDLGVYFWGGAGREKSARLTNNSEQFGFSADAYKDAIRGIKPTEDLSRRDIIGGIIPKQKNMIFDALSSEDLEKMGIEKPGDIEIRCETLVNEDVVRKILKKIFGRGKGSFDKIEGGDELEQKVNEFLEEKDYSDDELKKELETLIEDFKDSQEGALTV
jgi:hypothetical protein